ncbi:unnamed protein product [Amaranthus hypochondriacus]
MANAAIHELVFSKHLTKTDIERRLSWPIENLHLLTNLRTRGIDLNSPGHKFDFVAMDQYGGLWPLSCTIRKDGYAKPVLSAGWIPFVNSQNLVIGDEVMFYRTNDHAVGAPAFIIHVRRAH